MTEEQFKRMVKKRNEIYLKKFLRKLIKMKREHNVTITRKGINLNIAIN